MEDQNRKIRKKASRFKGKEIVIDDEEGVDWIISTYVAPAM